jgi:hypothetical protein
LSLEVKVENDTVWLNRNQMAVLFDRDVKTIGKHINNALHEELAPTVAKNATLHVYLDEDEMEYRAEMEDNLHGTEDDGIYPITDLIRDGEPDNDKASDIANSWIFLD